nr:serine/threonine kinase-like domain-containing protein STKLD1 isoform X2 [Pogona vitticeps]
MSFPSLLLLFRELVDHPFVRDCLILAGSPLIKVKKHVPVGLMDIVLDAGIQTVLEFMMSYQEIEEAQEKSIERLLELLKKEDALGKNLKVEMLACENILGCLLNSMRTYSDNEGLLWMICTLFMMMSTREAAVEALRKAGVFTDMLTILSNFAHNKNISLACCGVIWSLVANGTDVAEYPLKYAIEVVSIILHTHLDDGETAESACSAFWALSLHGCIDEAHYEPYALLLLEALRRHPARPVLAKNACLALASLLRTSGKPLPILRNGAVWPKLKIERTGAYEKLARCFNVSLCPCQSTSLADVPRDAVLNPMKIHTASL